MIMKYDVLDIKIKRAKIDIYFFGIVTFGTEYGWDSLNYTVG